MKKIIVLYPYNTGGNAFSGGVPKVVVSNIIAINKNGDNPFLVLPTENTGLISFIKENYPFCNIIPVKFKSLSLFSDTKGINRYLSIFDNLLGFYLGKNNLKSAIKKISPDIIHFHEIINFPILNVYPQAKIVLHLHSYRFTGYGRLLGLIMKEVNKYSDIVISPTKSILSALNHRLKVKAIVIDTPYLELKNEISSNISIIEQITQAKREGKIIFSFVGRICSIKRIDHFLKAINSLEERLRERVFFSIVGGINTEGDKDYKNELVLLIKKYGLEDIVNFHGYVNPIESILPYIDYGIILSESEAVPMIGIEYMRFNIPIIGYNAPGISDFLIDRINGFVVENGNIQELSEDLRKIIDEKYVDIEFSRTIPITFKRHTIEEFTKAIGEVYSSV